MIINNERFVENSSTPKFYPGIKNDFSVLAFNLFFCS